MRLYVQLESTVRSFVGLGFELRGSTASGLATVAFRIGEWRYDTTSPVDLAASH